MITPTPTLKFYHLFEKLLLDSSLFTFLFLYLGYHFTNTVQRVCVIETWQRIEV